MTDERGVTVPLNYVLLVGIVALLSAGLLASTSGYVEREQTQAVDGGLAVVGQRAAADVGAADRLVRAAGPGGAVRLTVALPEGVAGSEYLIGIEPAPPPDTYRLTIRSISPERTATVRVRVRTPLRSTTVAGGDLTIRYDRAAAELVVSRADE